MPVTYVTRGTKNLIRLRNECPHHDPRNHAKLSKVSVWSLVRHAIDCCSATRTPAGPASSALAEIERLHSSSPQKLFSWGSIIGLKFLQMETFSRPADLPVKPFMITGWCVPTYQFSQKMIYCPFASHARISSLLK
jgi:hypothetical protein